ncbi:hypothetical protein [Ruania alba]|uniref:hypothetical protein n=1 Tax=Ruania alba TaxID=648782 RepID=UPI001587CA09|nr:hypothetical protein [Ruania alba]
MEQEHPIEHATCDHVEMVRRAMLGIEVLGPAPAHLGRIGVLRHAQDEVDVGERVLLATCG